MINKLVYKSQELDNKTIEAVRKLADPIRQTMGPMGGNVLYEDAAGRQQFTNDGFTVAKNISSSDPVINQVLEVIKSSSLKTNQEAGDGTSSTVLYSDVLIEEGLKLIRNGWNPINIKNKYNEVARLLKKEIEKNVLEVKNDNDLVFLANVSSSNDKEITENTVKTIKITGKEGQVIIDPGYTENTELVEDTGFIIQSGLFSQELSQNKSFAAKYDEVPVLITDKRLYYSSEAEKILQTIIDNGYKSVVIIASDFIGEALPYLVENHKRGNVNVLLVKETKPEILEDLAIYLGGDVISDKSGSLDNLDIEHFSVAKMTFSNMHKTIISRDKKEQNPGISIRVSEIQKQMKEIGNKNDGDYKALEKRIASLTKGMVTIKVGGRTGQEINEKIFRYEDAINAVRVAIDSGYVVGGGVTIYNAWKKVNKKNIDGEIVNIFNRLSTETIKQIASNSGHSPDIIVSKMDEVQEEMNENWGFNAMKGKMSNLLEDGVIEPYKVISQVIDNSISIAIVLITSRYRIVTELKEDNK